VPPGPDPGLGVYVLDTGRSVDFHNTHADLNLRDLVHQQNCLPGVPFYSLGCGACPCTTASRVNITFPYCSRVLPIPYNQNDSSTAPPVQCTPDAALHLESCSSTPYGLSLTLYAQYVITDPVTGYVYIGTAPAGSSVSGSWSESLAGPVSSCWSTEVELDAIEADNATQATIAPTILDLAHPTIVYGGETENFWLRVLQPQQGQFVVHLLGWNNGVAPPPQTSPLEAAVCSN